MSVPDDGRHSGLVRRQGHRRSHVHDDGAHAEAGEGRGVPPAPASDVDDYRSRLERRTVRGRDRPILVVEVCVAVLVTGGQALEIDLTHGESPGPSPGSSPRCGTGSPRPSTWSPGAGGCRRSSASGAGRRE